MIFQSESGTRKSFEWRALFAAGYFMYRKSAAVGVKEDSSLECIEQSNANTSL